VRCGLCGGTDLVKVLDLGMSPLANAFGSMEKYPLNVVFCRSCTLAQLGYRVPPSVLFRQDYAYATGASAPAAEHFRSQAMILASLLEGDREFVVEIGSNDGTMLTAFRVMGLKALGVDPGFPGVPDTVHSLFSEKVAEQIVSERGNASLVVANNVLAHNEDLHDFLSGVHRLLRDGGLFSAEVHYAGDLIQNNEYDTIYHEHCYYFTAKTLCAALRSHGLQPFLVDRIEQHGGSLHVLARKRAEPYGSGTVWLEEAEDAVGLNSSSSWESLGMRVAYQREMLVRLFQTVEQAVGYGAPAKAAVLANYCGIDGRRMPYAIDTTPAKQGRTIPGTDIPICPPERFRREKPDYTLLFVWNYMTDILRREKSYKGRWIVPLPSPRLV
jgi:SAM-dependent methyltransferase